MNRNKTLAIAVAMALGITMQPLAAPAQIPGLRVPGGVSLPTGGLSKDALLEQAKSMVSDLVSMKSSGKLTGAQTQQVDVLLPKATSLTSELEAPNLDTGKLTQLAGNVAELQQQVGALKSLMP
jgi:hypothetical protein